MDLHRTEEILFEGHPSWRGLVSFYASAVGGAVAVAVVVALIFGVVAALVVAAVLVAIALLAGFVERRATRYLVTTQRLHIRRGVLTPKTQQTRIDRVQSVHTERTVVDRIARVGTVDFDTAGTDDSRFRFVRIASPDLVVATVDRARREAVERAAEPPRFVHGPGTTRSR